MSRLLYDDGFSPAQASSLLRTLLLPPSGEPTGGESSHDHQLRSKQPFWNMVLSVVCHLQPCLCSEIRSGEVVRTWMRDCVQQTVGSVRAGERVAQLYCSLERALTSWSEPDVAVLCKAALILLHTPKWLHKWKGFGDGHPLCDHPGQTVKLYLTPQQADKQLAIFQEMAACFQDTLASRRSALGGVINFEELRARLRMWAEGGVNQKQARKLWQAVRAVRESLHSSHLRVLLRKYVDEFDAIHVLLARCVDSKTGRELARVNSDTSGPSDHDLGQGSDSDNEIMIYESENESD